MGMISEKEDEEVEIDDEKMGEGFYDFSCS